MIVKLVNKYSNEEPETIESLSFNKEYEVLEISGKFYRVS